MSNSRLIRNLSLTLLFVFTAPLIANAQSTFQASNVLTFTDLRLKKGAGTLLRKADSVELRFQMIGLDRKAAYTLWWIIFNEPDMCMAGGVGVCGETDVMPDGPADAGVRNAGAFITGTDGTANITAELDVGPAPTGPAAAGFGELKDSVGAVIHIVVQTHDRPLKGSVAEQMTIPGAACNDECEDQFVIFFDPVAP
jgi:hypothetical protein